MDKQKVFFPSNLKFLRNRKKLSQESLAENLSFTRAKLTSLENGATKTFAFEDLIKISDYFKISIDTLLRVELARLGEFKMRNLEAGNDVYMSGSNLRVLAITVDSKNRENTEYVPVKAKAGYRAGHNDPEYIATLPKFTLPNLKQDRTHRMFGTTGDSMLPIPENSDVVCEPIEDWNEVKPKTICIVILKDQDFVFKQVTIQKEVILLESLNTQYGPYAVQITDVLELWAFKRFISDTIPDIAPDLQSIAKTLKEILGDVASIKNKN